MNVNINTTEKTIEVSGDIDMDQLSKVQHLFEGFTLKAQSAPTTVEKVVYVEKYEYPWTRPYKPYWLGPTWQVFPNEIMYNTRGTGTFVPTGDSTTLSNYAGQPTSVFATCINTPFTLTNNLSN